MSSDYYASVTFPVAALRIPAIKAAFDEVPEDYTDFFEEMALVSNPAASGGYIAMTEVLKQFQVPYDHHHRNNIDMDDYTEQVRFVDGVETVVSTTDDEHALIDYAKEVLALLETGDVAGATQRLREVTEKDPGPTIMGDVAWSADHVYYLYAPSENNATPGEGFWSNDHGWCGTAQATVFSQTEKDTFALPASAGHDAGWSSVAEVIASVPVSADATPTKFDLLFAEVLDGLAMYYPSNLDDLSTDEQKALKNQTHRRYVDTGNALVDYERMRDAVETYLNARPTE